MPPFADFFARLDGYQEELPWLCRGRDENPLRASARRLRPRGRRRRLGAGKDDAGDRGVGSLAISASVSACLLQARVFACVREI